MFGPTFKYSLIPVTTHASLNPKITKLSGSFWRRKRPLCKVCTLAHLKFKQVLFKCDDMIIISLFRCDVTKPEDVAALYDAAEEYFKDKVLSTLNRGGGQNG